MFKDRYQTMQSLARLLALSVLSCLFLACATTANHHTTYNYANITCPIGVLPQPGNQFSTLEKPDIQVLTIKWQARPGPDISATTPLQVTLQAKLLGPFSSLDVFQQIFQDGSTKYLPDNPVVAVAPTIQTTNWVNQTYMSNLQFSQKLVAGYYQVVETIDMNNGAQGSGRCIIKV